MRIFVVATFVVGRIIFFFVIRFIVGAIVVVIFVAPRGIAVLGIGTWFVLIGKGAVRGREEGQTHKRAEYALHGQGG